MSDFACNFSDRNEGIFFSEIVVSINDLILNPKTDISPTLVSLQIAREIARAAVPTNACLSKDL